MSMTDLERIGHLLAIIDKGFDGPANWNAVGEAIGMTANASRMRLTYIKTHYNKAVGENGSGTAAATAVDGSGGDNGGKSKGKKRKQPAVNKSKFKVEADVMDSIEDDDEVPASKKTKVTAKKLRAPKRKPTPEKLSNRQLSFYDARRKKEAAAAKAATKTVSSSSSSAANKEAGDENVFEEEAILDETSGEEDDTISAETHVKEEDASD